MEEGRGEGAVSLEAATRPARDHLQLVGHARGERTERHGLRVDRHHPLAAPDLLLEQILEEVAALGAVPVGGEALPLAGDHGRHEREGVQLGVRMGQRGARLGPLVQAQVHVGRVLVRTHALTPHVHRDLHLARLEVQQ